MYLVEFFFHPGLRTILYYKLLSLTSIVIVALSVCEQFFARFRVLVLLQTLSQIITKFTYVQRYLIRVHFLFGKNKRYLSQ